MTLALRNEARVPFHGAQLLARKDGDDVYVAVKPICEHLGIAYQPQHKKLVEDGKFNCHLMHMTAEDGKHREMLVIERRDLLGWVYGISPKKVGQGKPERERAALAQLLVAYQRESSDALYSYWATRLTTSLPVPAPAPAHVLPSSYSDALRQLADSEDAKAALVLENARMQPKAEAFERLMDTDGTYSMAEAAKIIGRADLGPQGLFELLRERGILMTGGEKHNLPYQQYLDRGYFKVRAGERPSSSGGTKPTSTTRVTPKGLDWICKNVLKIALPARRLDFGTGA